MDRREALTILNVKQNSSQEEIKASYRKMALELHPDKNKENYEDAKFKKITEAYNFLKKNKVDNTIHQQTKKNSGNQRAQDLNHNGVHQIMETSQNKIGVNIHVNLKKVIQLFGKNMKKNFGRIIMHEYEQTVKTENMKKQKNQISNQIFRVEVDKSLCIGCCSCEIIAPEYLK